MPIIKLRHSAKHKIIAHRHALTYCKMNIMYANNFICYNFAPEWINMFSEYKMHRHKEAVRYYANYYGITTQTIHRYLKYPKLDSELESDLEYDLEDLQFKMDTLNEELIELTQNECNIATKVLAKTKYIQEDIKYWKQVYVLNCTQLIKPFDSKNSTDRS